MLESLGLYNSILNNKWFLNTPMILFLNKKDLFEAKIKRVPITVCFPDYNDEHTYEATTMFIKNKFEPNLESGTKPFYFHFTCATSTENIGFNFRYFKF
jgi:guanine nucleotide-binding protein G(z) subunit alpha